MYKSNKIFSSRADEMICMDISEIDPDKRVEKRRPDRIIGFQETHSFSRRLDEYDHVDGQSESAAGNVTLWETVKSNVLNHKGNSLLFPFLIIEARSRHGAPFDSCNLQTAIPILTMLKMQARQAGRKPVMKEQDILSERKRVCFQGTMLSLKRSTSRSTQ